MPDKTYQALAEDSWIKVEALFSVSRRSIGVSYTATAQTTTPILVFDGPRRLMPQGELKLAPTLAYVSFEPPDTLAIKRIIPPLPEKKEVEMAYIPWAHQAMASQPHHGEAIIPLPAEEYNPYYPSGRTAAYRNASASKIKLVLGYLPLGGHWKAVGVPNEAGLFTLEESTVGEQRSDQQVIQIEVELSAPITVRRRTDLFEAI